MLLYLTLYYLHSMVWAHLVPHVYMACSHTACICSCICTFSEWQLSSVAGRYHQVPCATQLLVQYTHHGSQCIQSWELPYTENWRKQEESRWVRGWLEVMQKGTSGRVTTLQAIPGCKTMHINAYCKMHSKRLKSAFCNFWMLRTCSPGHKAKRILDD